MSPTDASCLRTLTCLALGAALLFPACTAELASEAEVAEFDRLHGETSAKQVSPHFALAQRAAAEPERNKQGGVLPVIDGRWLVLGNAEEDWGVGATLLHSQRDADTGVSSRALSAAHTAQFALEGSLTLRGDDGQACEAKAGALRVLRRMAPDYEQRERWQGQTGPAPSKLRIAGEVWEAGAGYGLVVAELPKLSADCGTPSFGYFSTATAPVVLSQMQPAPDDARAYALAAQAFIGLKQLPLYQRLQRDYDTYNAELAQGGAAPEPASWETHAAAEPRLLFWGDGSARFIGWHLRAGEGCGDFYGNLSVIYEVVDAPDGAELKLVELSEAKPAPERIVTDGAALELWDADGVRTPGAEEPRLQLLVPSFGCSC